MPPPAWSVRLISLLPPRALPILFVPLACVAAACGEGAGDPVIAVPYRALEKPFHDFLEQEVERRRPAGAVRVRVRGSDSIPEALRGEGPIVQEVDRAERIAADPAVVVVVGPGGSREVLQTAPIHAAAGIPQVVPTGTSRLLAAVQPPLILLAPNDSVQGELLGAFADRSLRARRAAVLYTPDEYGIGLAAGVRAALARRGAAAVDLVPVSGTRDCIDPAGDAYFGTLAASLGTRLTPDVALLATRTHQTGCLAAALSRRFPGIALVAGEGTSLEATLLVRARGGAEGMYLLAYWHRSQADSAAGALADRFERATGRRLRHGDVRFVEAVLLAAATIWAVGPQRDAVGAYLRGLGTARPAFAGLTGPLVASPRGAEGLFMTRVTGDGSELVRW